MGHKFLDEPDRKRRKVQNEEGGEAVLDEGRDLRDPDFALDPFQDGAMHVDIGMDMEPAFGQ